MKRTVEEGIEPGDFDPVDVRSAMLLLISALNWAHKWYSPAERAPQATTARARLTFCTLTGHNVSRAPVRPVPTAARPIATRAPSRDRIRTRAPFSCPNRPYILVRRAGFHGAWIRWLPG